MPRVMAPKPKNRRPGHRYQAEIDQLVLTSLSRKLPHYRGLLLGLVFLGLVAIILMGAWVSSNSQSQTGSSGNGDINCQNGTNRQKPICQPPARATSWPVSHLRQYHNQQPDCWISIDGVVYDISRDRQPAYQPPPVLKPQLDQLCGQNVSGLFNRAQVSPPRERFIKGHLQN